ncbi:putative holin-like toxin [Bacillus sp. cl95]
MTISEVLTSMLAFGSLVVAILAFRQKK